MFDIRRNAVRMHKSQSSPEASESILSWIFFGLLAGIVAKLLTPGRCVITMLPGVAGAFVGVVVVLLLYRLLAGRRARPSKGRPPQEPFPTNPPQDADHPLHPLLTANDSH